MKSASRHRSVKFSCQSCSLPSQAFSSIQTHTILRLSTLLHGRISRDVLSYNSSGRLSDPTVENLDQLSPLSSALLVASDDLVSTLYPPQNSTDISTELVSFTDVISRMRSTLLALLRELSLTKQLENITLQSQPTSTRDPIKWFETCLNQIDKAVLSLQNTLQPPARP